MGYKAKRTLEREALKAANKPAPVQNAKQIRARARRAQRLADNEWNKLYKPVSEWDSEELARGRPRASDGSFAGKAPAWINREIHEETIRRFQEVVKGEMNVHTVSALKVISNILENDETDDKDRPIVPASTKLEAAKFLLEHVVGKPTQRTETDISVRLQGVLGAAMVPAEALPTAVLQHAAGIIDAEVVDDDSDLSVEDSDG